MTIQAEAIVSITEATKHFRATCDKTRRLGTTFIFKNNSPDIVMMDISHYERLFQILDTLEDAEIASIIARRNAADNGVRIPLGDVIGA
jgi:PHD/YefM family antitoxin component YafN of YafNO toxin-antitoxin module